jgi:hypothetical protein
VTVRVVDMRVVFDDDVNDEEALFRTFNMDARGAALLKSDGFGHSLPNMDTIRRWTAGEPEIMKALQTGEPK